MIPTYTLPPGYHLPGPPRRCPECGRPLEEVDRVEGLPILACKNRCGIEDNPEKGPNP
jgi:hypothetical protein